MVKNLISKKNTVLFQYLLSYLGILVLVVGVVVVISTFTLRAVEEAAYTQSLAKMGRIQDSIDTHLRSVESFALTLVTREDVVAIAAALDGLRPFHRYQAYNLIKELRRYEVSNDAYSGVYLYFSNEDFVVSTTGSREAQEFFETAGYGLSLREWQSMLNTQYFAEFKSFGGEDGFVEYWFPISGHSEEFKTGVAVLRLREDKVNRMIGGLLWSEEETIAVLDRDRVVFQVEGSAGSPAVLWYGAHQDAGQFVSGGTVISSVGSQVTDWFYLSALPQSYFIQQTRYLQSIVVFCIVLAIVIIVIFTVLGLWNNYRPIRNIIGMLRGRPEDLPTREDKGSEYKMIEHSVRKILSNYDSAKKQLVIQKEAIRNSILSDLLNNRFDGIVSLDDTLHFYEIVFKGSIFAAYVLYERKDSEDRILEEEPLPGRMNKVFMDLLRGEGFDAYGVEERGFAVGLVGMRPGGGAEDEMEVLKRLLEQGYKIIHDKYFTELTIALGGAKEGSDGIVKSYREACSVVDYLAFIGKTPEIVCEYAKIQEKDVDETCHPGRIAALNQLSNLIAARDFQQAKTLSLGMIDEAMEKDYDVKLGSCFKFSMISAILEGLSALQDEELDKWQESPAEQILSCESIAQLRSGAESLLDDLDSYYKNKYAAHSNDIIREITDYIEENYGDYGLGVSQIADAFNLKVPFLSKLFKKHAGIGLLDYITTLRLNHIKALLLSSDMNLNEIARETGFINASALIRTFKRYEGITPGKYKEAYQNTTP